MARTRTLGIRLTSEEESSVRVLMRERNYESASHLIRALIREALCTRKGQIEEGLGTKAEIEDIAQPVDAGIV